MSVYPFDLDSDQTIIRIDDNVTEQGGESINQLRDAVFNIEAELGIGLSGSMGSLASRLDVSLNANGSIKASALTSVGLATLPIVDNQVASNAGIKEYKLTLDHSTSDLYTLIVANATLLASVNAFATLTNSDFNSHLAGSQFLADGSTSARHVASHIDLNAVPFDARDTFYTWTGLLDKNGVARSSTHVAAALLEINDDLVNHENATEDAHLASAITVNTDEFQELPTTANTVQKVVDYLDDFEVLTVGQHRATQHAAGIPPIARSQSLTLPDGYGDNVVPPTTVATYLVHAPANYPVDSNSIGDDLIKFVPASNSDFSFDAAFSQVKIGDIIRVNYANGLESSFPIESVRYTPGSEWVVRIAGINLCESSDGYGLARIDRPAYDYNTAGVLALAAANAVPTASYSSILPSLIVGHPRGATAVGLGFDPNQIDATHYKLYLELYPSGNPLEKIISMPAIDISGNTGTTPGSYTLEKVVLATNDAFRALGYNYRFIAFDHLGDFGLMLADPIGNASFAIVSGSNSSGTLAESSYTENVIGDATDGFDALGLGATHADVASPAYQSTWVDASAAQLPTKVIAPIKNRFYIANGQRLNGFAPTYLATEDGYWPATIIVRNNTGSSIETTYRVNLALEPAKLKIGKTLVVQPDIDFTNPDYMDADYGRFIIKDVTFVGACGSDSAYTTITVISGIHATGNPLSASSDSGQTVRLYFSEDSVSFNDLNVIDASDSGVNFHRYHEIYITDQGQTLSHERGRMPIQGETTSGLRTDFWHINSVSPKLRGYQSGTVVLNKYLRFYILSYDATSGEFDGYIGQPGTGVGILNPGPITTGRKNVPVKFYDETYLDYLEMTFEEINVGPSGIAVVTDGFPHYVDIEVFPTLRQDDELMLIGSCEVNWSPSTHQTVIQKVKNLRQFGSIDELDFTQSAKDFITNGDRLLHENGIIRGFEFVSVNASDNREIFYTGGVALVNGTMVTTNNSSVTIPQISEGGTPATVIWAVCVNQNGYLEPIIVTTTKDQFFAQASLYYVQSVTFAELISSRKDLTVISLVTATIASITINASDVKDARRFIQSENLGGSLVWTSGDLPGHFSTFESLAQWINYLGGQKNVVKVNGNFSVDTMIDMTVLTAPVVLEGEGATFTVTSDSGFKITNNTTFRNINFVYNPRLTYTANDRINTGYGCLYSNSDLNSVTIEKCTFTSPVLGSQRPPFIGLELAPTETIKNIIIRDNVFSDDVAITQAAIAIVNVNSAGASPAVVANCLIENNKCKQSQGIYLTSVAAYSVSGGVTVTTFEAPGLTPYACSIVGNTAETIGFLAGGLYSSDYDGYGLDPSITVSRNHGLYCGVADSLGHSWSVNGPTYLVLEYGTANTTVSENHMAWINCVVENSTTDKTYSNLTIVNNQLQAFYPAYLEAQLTCLQSMAIIATGTTEKGSVIISNNSINSRNYNNTTLSNYRIGIWCPAAATITNNIIKGLGDTADLYGIILRPKSGETTEYLVQGNRIYRNGTDMGTGAYIYNSGSTTPSYSSALVVDNYFDSFFIDSGNTDTNTVKNAPVTWVVDRNKNQIYTTYISAESGRLKFAGAVLGTAGLATTTGHIETSSATTGYSLFDYYETANSNMPQLTWTVDLHDILPYGVIIHDASISAESNLAFDTSGTFSFLIQQINPVKDVNGDVFPMNFTSGGGYVANTILTSTATPLNTTDAETIRVTQTSGTRIRLFGTLKDTATTGRVEFTAIAVRYRY